MDAKEAASLVLSAAPAVRQVYLTNVCKCTHCENCPEQGAKEMDDYGRDNEGMGDEILQQD